MAAANDKARARKARTTTARKAATQPTPDQPDVQVQQPDGVLLIKQPTADGGIQVIPQVIGNVQVTEMTTLIELGLKAVRQNLGLDERK